MRHALMYERLMPIYDSVSEAQAENLNDLPTAAKLPAYRRKLEAGKLLPTLKGVLFPEDG